MDAAFTPFRRAGSGSPLVCLHGFTDTWRTWDLVLPALSREHDVLAVTLAGHAGGPPLPDRMTREVLPDGVERAMDAAGFETAHIVGNSLGGYVALELAARGRARSVVALAPAGGWAEGDPAQEETMRYFVMMQDLVAAAAPRAEEIAAHPEGRRRATEMTARRFEHIPAELIAHMIRGAAGCTAALPFVEFARREGWPMADPAVVACPVMFVWGDEDRLLAWPSAAARYRERWPHAEWVTLEGVGHCPQLDVPAETADLIRGFATS